MSTHQWNGRGVVARRGVDHDVVGDVAEQRRAAAPARRAARAATRAISSSVALVEARPRVRRARCAPRTASSTPAGTSTTASPSTTSPSAACVDRVGDQVAARPAKRSSSVVDARRHEVERDELRVRMLDRRARGLAVVHERLRVREPGVEVERGAVAQRDAARRSRRRVDERAESASCAGESTTTSCAPGDAVADDRVLVRHDAHAASPACRARPRRARDLGRRLALVARRRTGTSATASPAAVGAARGTCRAAVARAGRDDHARRRSARRRAARCIGWSG